MTERRITPGRRPGSRPTPPPRAGAIAPTPGAGRDPLHYSLPGRDTRP